MAEPLNILILEVQVPFTRGGAEELSDQLSDRLKSRGHSVDRVALPFSALPKTDVVRHMLNWRSLELSDFGGRTIDLVIPTKFPSYLVRHPCKVPWLVHQHRQVYELYGGRFSDFDESAEDEALRRMIYEADSIAFAECASIFTIAQNVSDRLERFLGVQSRALTPPSPFASRCRTGEKGSYILSVGRLCSIKRVDLMVRSLAKVSRRLHLKVVGAADEPAIEEYLKSEVRKHHLQNRVEFLGRVTEPDLIELYANAFAVYYAPHDEDYGFVSIEALAAGKPVVTASDSGTVLSFIRDGVNGLVTDPVEAQIAQAFNTLLENESLYTAISRRVDPETLTSSWEEIVETLTASVRSDRSRTVVSES